MDIVTEIISLDIINYVVTGNTYLTIYTYFLLFIVFFETILLFIFNLKLKKKYYIIKKNKINNDPFLTQLLEDYRSKLEIQHDEVNTNVFIKDYFDEHNRFWLYLLSFIDQSDIIFLLIGLLAAFLNILTEVVSLNLTGISGFTQLYTRLEGMIISLKPALFFIITGIIASIITIIIKKVFNTDNRLSKFKLKLENYLENNIKHKYSKDLKKIKLIELLIQTIDNSFIQLENVLDDAIHESVAELKDFFRKKGERIEEKITDNKNDKEKTELDTKEIFKQIAAAKERKNKEKKS